MDDYSAARSEIIPPLQWTTFSPPFSLAVDTAITFQPAVDEPSKPIQLGALYGRRAPIARRNRKRQHLTNAVARNPEMPRCLPLAHAVRTSQTNLPVKFHCENPTALPVARKGKSGRLFRRPQRDYPAAPVDDFLTAVLSHVCARHIIASGVKVVTFIEPYEKSMALDQYEGIIALDDDSLSGVLQFRPFIGVAPSRFITFFESGKRKDSSGKVRQFQESSYEPKLPAQEHWRYVEEKIAKEV